MKFRGSKGIARAVKGKAEGGDCPLEPWAKRRRVLLAGYAVECALKACIAKDTRRGEFPDRKKVESSYSHNLLQLIRVAGLDEACEEQARRDAAFRNNWDCVQSWSEQSRYRRYPTEAARAMLVAVGDRRHGVISWIKQRW